MPAIFQFLGFDPFPELRSLPERLLAKRRERGWSIEEAAKFANVDPGTWAGWEHGRTVLYRRHRARIAKMLGLSFDALDKEMAARWVRLHGGDL
jgi:transcriptional regulator with XRE-family HTH domain